MPAGLDPLERELAEIDAEFEQTPPKIRKKFGVIPIIVLFFVLVTFSGLLWYSYSVGVRAGSEDAAPLLELSGPIANAALVTTVTAIPISITKNPDAR